MLALTKRTGYALIAMSHLAELPPGALSSAREIAEAYDVPASLLMNVLKELASAGYVESVRGAHGGYRLACEPESVNLAELVEAIEGPVRLAECVLNVGDDAECTCQVMSRCPVADPVHRVQRKLQDFLRKVSLAEITATAAEPSGEKK